jgi:hypothetical protein
MATGRMEKKRRCIVVIYSIDHANDIYKQSYGLSGHIYARNEFCVRLFSFSFFNS